MIILFHRPLFRNEMTPFLPPFIRSGDYGDFSRTQYKTLGTEVAGACPNNGQSRGGGAASLGGNKVARACVCTGLAWRGRCR